MIWLNWLCTCFEVKGLWVQTLLEKKLELSFCLILFSFMGMKRDGNPSCQEGQPKGLETTR